MEENKDKETESLRRDGTIVICTTLVIGYILGRMSSNQIAVDSYRRGVSDTLNSIVFRQR
jgi:hypothetical protein